MTPLKPTVNKEKLEDFTVDENICLKIPGLNLQSVEKSADDRNPIWRQKSCLHQHRSPGLGAWRVLQHPEVCWTFQISDFSIYSTGLSFSSII